MAVRHVCLQAYPGDVTVLLGRNGAGKTTLLRLITGLEQATEGTVIVGGHDVATDTDSARRSMGFCPQENILFPGLTVLEHLQLFARVNLGSDSVLVGVQGDQNDSTDEVTGKGVHRMQRTMQCRKEFRQLSVSYACSGVKEGSVALVAFDVKDTIL